MGEERGGRVGDGLAAAIYVRTPQYNEQDRTTAEEQLRACRAVAEELGYRVEEALTIEEDAPNSALSRPGMSRLIGLLTGGGASALITHSLDRLARPESEGLEALLRNLRRRGVPLYLARVPKGYRYDPATGKLLHDDALVAAASREDARPPEYIVIPRETEQVEMMADFQAMRGAIVGANGREGE